MRMQFVCQLCDFNFTPRTLSDCSFTNPLFATCTDDKSYSVILFSFSSYVILKKTLMLFSHNFEKRNIPTYWYFKIWVKYEYWIDVFPFLKAQCRCFFLCDIYFILHCQILHVLTKSFRLELYDNIYIVYVEMKFEPSYIASNLKFEIATL